MKLHLKDHKGSYVKTTEDSAGDDILSLAHESAVEDISLLINVPCRVSFLEEVRRCPVAYGLPTSSNVYCMCYTFVMNTPSTEGSPTTPWNIGIGPTTSMVRLPLEVHCLHGAPACG
ncbi:hypothetical protein M404DRAFT_440655 [Pisolithus tinctorius Marx 270]|uniref:Uncharacterized protein n=1 Tax=Pisolithus tinctorius Marx 270 TaxID=870435 RepID=A0A0C3PEV4_PISTI|nr:hypothetical protein M404DRAFT_440655 [Pisolithus tinctorius Marx 270]